MNHNLTLNADNTSIQVTTLTGRFLSVLEATGEFEIKLPDMVGFTVDIADEIDLGADIRDGVQIQLVNRCGVTNTIKLADSPVSVQRKKRVSLDVDSLPVELAEGSEIRVNNLADFPAPVVNVDVPETVVNLGDTVVEAPIVTVAAPVAGSGFLVESMQLVWEEGSSGIVKELEMEGIEKIIAMSDSNSILLGQFPLQTRKYTELSGLDKNHPDLAFKCMRGSRSVLDLLLFRRAEEDVPLSIVAAYDLSYEDGGIADDYYVTMTIKDGATPAQVKQTDDNGHVEFELIEGGNYILSISGVVSGNVVVDSTQSTINALVIDSPNVVETVFHDVRAVDNHGNIVAGHTMIMRKTSDSSIQEKTSDENGFIRFELEKDAVYNLDARPGTGAPMTSVDSTFHVSRDIIVLYHAI